MSSSIRSAEYDVRQYWTRLHDKQKGRLSAVGYAELGEGFNRFAYLIRRRGLARLLGRGGVTAANLLEAAAGVGAYEPLWRRLDAGRWTGFDISEEAAAHCRRRFPAGVFCVEDLRVDRWETPRIGAEEFDLVTGIDLLYHLVDDAAFSIALDKLAARVKDGGWLVVTDVFVERDRQIAPHVKRRSLSTYQDVLGPRMALVDREPIFAILADPVPRSGHAADRLLLNGWRLLAKTLRLTPSPARDAVGAAMVLLGWPVDAMLRGAGAARGVNLEAALFRKTRLGAEA